MRLLVDSDIFCKLAVGGVLDDAVRLFGLELGDCGRLPALPHMLRRGRLRKQFGDAASDALIPHAERITPIVPATSEWLDPLVGHPNLDPGEAQLFALAAQDGLVVMSGDKRALVAVKAVPKLRLALAERVVVLEALLIRLCDVHGVDRMRGRVGNLRDADSVVRVCFSDRNADPVGAFSSYYEGLVRDVAPLKLWNPRPEAST